MGSNTSTLELGTKPVGRLLTQYALPAIMAMTAQSLYNTTDSIFIGQGVGPMAISGLAVTFPFMNLAGAFGAAVGIGAATCISVKLGQRDYETAERVFGNNISLNILIGIIFGAVCLVFLDDILRFFGASEQTLPYARDYMTVILTGNWVTHIYHGLNSVIRASGAPRTAMVITITTVVLNIILDPIFIYVFGLGIRGAAIATMLSQCFAMVWESAYFTDTTRLLHFKRGIYKFNGMICKNIIAIGLSPFFMNACSCLIVILINRRLVEYGGDLSVGAFGISNRITFVFLMVVIGLNQGMQPIAGYNYGAEKTDRVIKVLKYTIVAATCVTVVGYIVSRTIPGLCARLFTTDAELIVISANALVLTMSVFPIVGAQMVITNFFQSIGKAKVSIFLALSRQLIFLLPALFILPTIYGLDGVWLSLPTADGIATVTTVTILLLYIKKMQKGARV